MEALTPARMLLRKRDRCTSSIGALAWDLAESDVLPPQVPYTLTASRNDYLHAVVAYFDVTLSTSPQYALACTHPQNCCAHTARMVLTVPAVLLCQLCDRDADVSKLFLPCHYA